MACHVLKPYFDFSCAEKRLNNPPWNVVEQSEEADARDVDSGSAESAEGPGLEGLADGHVPLDGHAHCQINAACLSDHAHRVHHRGNVRKDVVKVMPEPFLRVRVNRRQPEHEDAGQNQDGVVTGQACKKRSSKQTGKFQYFLYKKVQSANQTHQLFSFKPSR